MTLPEILSITTTILFGLLALYFAVKEERCKKALKQHDAEQMQRLNEITLLKDIQEKIGYELDIEKVTSAIQDCIKSLFPSSTVSSLVIKDDKLIFNTYIQEAVSHTFLQQVKKNMLSSVSQFFTTSLPFSVAEKHYGTELNDGNTSDITSSFSIPLDVNGKTLGLINLSSTKSDLYKENEMATLKKIVQQVANDLSRLTQALKAEEIKLLAMIASLEDGVFMVDKNNTLLIINDAARDLLTIHNTNSTFVDVLEAFERKAVVDNTAIPANLKQKIKDAFTQKRVIEEKEVNIGKSTLHVFINPVIHDETNEVIGVSVLLHDISLEKNLATHKEDFMHMVVHELRAPLTAMKGAAELMEKSTTTLSLQEQQKMLRIIKEQSKRMLEEVSSLLDLAKIENGKFTIEKAPTNLSDLIKERLTFFEPQLLEKNITLIKNIDSDTPTMNIDAFRIGQVINNLLSNSIKFTPKGGSITVDTVYDRNNNCVEIAVADTGIGIPLEKQVLLFNKFSQVNTPSSGNGSGLGLFISKGIVDAHGGKITLLSEEGRGTTISFTLPVTESEKASPSRTWETHIPPKPQYFQRMVN